MHERYRAVNGLVMCIDRKRKQIGESTISELDILPSHHFVLVQLKRMGRAASQSQIAEMMQVSPASVARTIKSLDKDGYIARSGGADGRCNEIAITEKGERVLRQSCALFQAIDERCYADFSDEELIRLHELLEKMLKSLSRVKEDMNKEMKA